MQSSQPHCLAAGQVALKDFSALAAAQIEPVKQPATLNHVHMQFHKRVRIVTRLLLVMVLLCLAASGEDVLSNQAGTPIPGGDWTDITAGLVGLTNQTLPQFNTGWDKWWAVPAIDAVCGVASYYENSSEPNRNWTCYSISENRWWMQSMAGSFHNEHLQEGGHPMGTVGVDPTTSIALGQQGNSGTQVQETTKWGGWKYDFVGQVGIPQQTPQALTPGNQLATGVYDPFTKQYFTDPGSHVEYDNDPTHSTCTTNGSNCYNSNSMDRSGLTLNGFTENGNELVAEALNTADKLIYIFGGFNSLLPGVVNSVWTYNPATSTFLNPFPNQTTSASCHDNLGGNTCPAARNAAAFAYMAKRNLFVMFGGCNSSNVAGCTPMSDTWIYDPVAVTWTQLNPPHVPTQGVTGSVSNERLACFAEEDVCVLWLDFNSSSGHLWAFRYAPGSGAGYISKNYAYANPSASIGPLNRNTTAASSEGWAYSETLASSSTSLLLAHTETGLGVQGQNANFLRPYAQILNAGTSCGTLDSNFQCLGTTYQAMSPDSGSAYRQAFDINCAYVGTVPWCTWHEEDAGLSEYLFAKGWDGTGWNLGGLIPKVGTTAYQGQSQIISVGSVPTVIYREQTRDAGGSNQNPFETYCYVKQWNGTAWSAPLGGVALNTGYTMCDSASIATDGTNIFAAITVYGVAFSGAAGFNGVWFGPPQAQLWKWNGTTWAQQGASGNVLGSGCTGLINAGAPPTYVGTSCSRAYNVSVTVLGGVPYVAFVERTDTGTIQKLWVRKFSTGAWSTVGSSFLNRDQNAGWAFRPEITNDNTSLFLTWDEQGNDQPWLNSLQLNSPRGQKDRVYAAQLSTGGTLTYLGGALNADTANGSASHPSIAMFKGQPAVTWGEVQTATDRQVYLKQWNGTDWVAASATTTVNPVTAPGLGLFARLGEQR